MSTEPTAPPEPGDTPPGGNKTFTQEELDRIVSERLARERGKFADYDELKAKASQFDELTQSQQSDLERITGERDSLKTDNDSLATENLLLQVALQKGLVGEKASLVDRLKGGSKEELEADADQLLSLFAPQPATEFDGGPRKDPEKPADPVQEHNELLLGAVGLTPDNN